MTYTRNTTNAIGLPGLCALRIMRGLSRYDIADCLGVSYHSVYAWEMGKHSPGLRNLVKLCRLFHTTPNDMLGFTEAGTGWMQQADNLIAATMLH